MTDTVTDTTTDGNSVRDTILAAVGARDDLSKLGIIDIVLGTLMATAMLAVHFVPEDVPPEAFARDLGGMMHDSVLRVLAAREEHHDLAAAMEVFGIGPVNRPN